MQMRSAILFNGIGFPFVSQLLQHYLSMWSVFSVPCQRNYLAVPGETETDATADDGTPAAALC